MATYPASHDFSNRPMTMRAGSEASRGSRGVFSRQEVTDLMVEIEGVMPATRGLPKLQIDWGELWETVKNTRQSSGVWSLPKGQRSGNASAVADLVWLLQWL